MSGAQTVTHRPADNLVKPRISADEKPAAARNSPRKKGVERARKTEKLERRTVEWAEKNLQLRSTSISRSSNSTLNFAPSRRGVHNTKVPADKGWRRGFLTTPRRTNSSENSEFNIATGAET